MNNKQITISKNSFFKGEVSAASITIEGKVIGNLEASDSIFIKEDGWVEGDISAPNIYLAQGCYHKGKIYLDDLENASSAKINMNRLEFEREDKDRALTNDSESPKEQAVSTSQKASHENP